MNVDGFIYKCKTFDDLYINIQELSSQYKGKVFDRLTQLYLLTHPKYRMLVKNVWLQEEIPDHIRSHLNHPKDDFGIDQIVETHNGDYWSVQSKYRSNNSGSLTYKMLSTFSTLSFVNCRNISHGIVSHLSSKKIKNRHLLGDVSEINLSTWLSIDEILWEQIRLKTNNIVKNYLPRTPEPHQEVAINKIYEHLVDYDNSKATIIMPCGSGKSLIAFWASRNMGSKNIILAMPTLSLINQSYNDWLREIVALNDNYDIAIICSDTSVGSIKDDDYILDISELGTPVLKSIDQIKNFLQTNHNKKNKIIFTTYQSGQKIIDAANEINFEFDLTICDEAHKTTGNIAGIFSSFITDENFKTKKYLFMTATERSYRGESKNVVSMNNQKQFGKIIYTLTFAEAIERKIISDYKIVTLEVKEKTIEEFITNYEYVFSKDDNIRETQARHLAISIALNDLAKKANINHVVSFHSSIDQAQKFYKNNKIVFDLLKDKPMDHFHISSRISTGERSLILKNFVESKNALITNARCLTEGIDIPNVDTVVFADPKSSVIDIVQASGRALRYPRSKKTTKKFGYILVPLIIPDDEDFMEYSSSTNFKNIVRVITALSTADERIKEQFDFFSSHKKLPKNSILTSINENMVEEVSFSKFTESVYSKLWESISRANFISYEEAQKNVQKNNIKTASQYTKWRKDNKLFDHPSKPHVSYLFSGWVNWGVFTGTNSIANKDRKYLSYNEALKIIKKANLKSGEEYLKWRKENNISNLPLRPSEVYSEFTSMGEYLGTGNVAPSRVEFLNYQDFKVYLKEHNITKRSEYKEWYKKHKEDKIPGKPDNFYKKNSEWEGWGIATGTNRIATHQREYIPFSEFIIFINKLGIKKRADYINWHKKNNPPNIPRYAREVYLNDGFTRWENLFYENNKNNK
jgi:predicted helicase